MRVCFVSSYPPNHARLSEYANNLVAALAERSTIEELYVLADKSQSKNNGLTNNPKVKVLRVWKPNSALSVFHITGYIVKIRPDIVHFNVAFQSFGTNNVSNLAGLSLILISRLFGFRVLTGIHTLAEGTDLKKILRRTIFGKQDRHPCRHKNGSFFSNRRSISPLLRQKAYTTLQTSMRYLHPSWNANGDHGKS